MSLSIAVAEATRFLIKPLQASYPQAALSKLEIALETNLTAHYSPSWVPNEPVRGSGRRCMSLSSSCLPPRPIWDACSQCNVQWFEWIALFRYDEFDLFVDPGCVAIRYQNQIFTIWKAAPSRKTFAQQVLEEDKEDEEIFDRLRDAIAAPTWTTPIVTQFPVIPDRSTSPLSSISEQSRCSSRSSNSSSSTFSFASADTGSSRSSSGSSKSISESKQSRRDRSRQARVFVDITKTEVTPYDGGKTTVLTGGVMLGGGPKTAPKPKATTNAASMNSASWRSVRA